MKSLKHLIKKCPKCGKKGMKKIFQGNDSGVVLKEEEKKRCYDVRTARGCSYRVRYKKVSGNSKYKIIFKCGHKGCLETQEFIGNSYAKVAAEVRNNL